MPYAAKKHRPHGQTEKRQDNRRSANERGYDTAWIRIRDLRRRLSPCCVECQKQGKVTAVEIVDHIIPVHVRPDLRLDRDNTQSLCRACHAVKTHRDIKVYGGAR